MCLTWIWMIWASQTSRKISIYPVVVKYNSCGTALGYLCLLRDQLLFIHLLLPLAIIFNTYIWHSGEEFLGEDLIWKVRGNASTKTDSYKMKSGVIFSSSVRKRDQNWALPDKAEGFFFSCSLKPGDGQWSVVPGALYVRQLCWLSVNLLNTAAVKEKNSWFKWGPKSGCLVPRGLLRTFKAMQMFLKAIFLHSSSNCCLILCSIWCFRGRKGRMKWNLPVDPEHSSKVQFFLS